MADPLLVVLARIVSEVGSLPLTMEVTGPAERAWQRLPEPAQVAVTRMFVKFAEHPETMRGTRFQSRTGPSGWPLYAFRASLTLRVIAELHGPECRLVDIVQRKDRRYYSKERAG